MTAMSEYIATAPPGHYRLRHVVRSEVVKMLTTPATAITVSLTIAAGLLVTGLVTNNAQGRGFGFDPTQLSLTGLVVAGLTGGVFGAMLITSEYASGTIRATLAATPDRPLLLAAKLAVTAAATVVFCEAMSFASFFLGQGVLASRGAPTATLASHNALRAVAMTGAFIALLAIMSFGFGLICRSTAAAIASFAGVVFVLPLVMQGISEPARRYLPTFILTNSVMATVNPGPGSGPFSPLSPTVGLALMALYAAGVVAVGAVLFVKRDA